MTAQSTELSVQRSVTVNATQAHAFKVFTDGFNGWWPQTHHIAPGEMDAAIIEPRVGGRWMERSKDGSECEWGRVLAWDPPNRVLLSWHLNGQWAYDPDPSRASEVEVRFIAEAPNRTRVELDHRHLERAADGEAIRQGVSGEGGWSSLMAAYAAAAGNA
jgi:uncharacterized protein YndB with AHSA1/START domain